jgi:hypothetical protein
MHHETALLTARVQRRQHAVTRDTMLRNELVERSRIVRPVTVGRFCERIE